MLKRILIVDDNSRVRKMTRSFLESRNACEVCGEAVNGVDAIEKAETLNPDLILLDFSMPVMNGIEAGAILKTKLPKVPVILFTVHESPAIKTAAMSVGIRAVVMKTEMSRLAHYLDILLV